MARVYLQVNRLKTKREVIARSRHERIMDGRTRDYAKRRAEAARVVPFSRRKYLSPSVTVPSAIVAFVTRIPVEPHTCYKPAHPLGFRDNAIYSDFATTSLTS